MIWRTWGDEAHVEHAVGFVEHQYFDHVQVHFAALVEVQQAARCCNQNVAVARLKSLELLVEVHAADEAHDVEPGVFGQVLRVLGNLHDEFAGRRNDQRAGLTHVAVTGWWCLQQLGDGRDEERCGLAGTGLRPADGVATLQGKAQYLRLDRRAVGKPQVMNGMHQLWSQLEVVKPRLALNGLDHEIVKRPCRGAWWDGFSALLSARLGRRGGCAAIGLAVTGESIISWADVSSIGWSG